MSWAVYRLLERRTMVPDPWVRLRGAVMLPSCVESDVEARTPQARIHLGNRLPNRNQSQPGSGPRLPTVRFPQVRPVDLTGHCSNLRDSLNEVKHLLAER